MLNDRKIISKVHQDPDGNYVVNFVWTNPQAVPSELVGKISNWCYDNFGTGLVGAKPRSRVVQTWINDYTWRWIDNIGEGQIKFPNKADFAWFMLAWQ